MNHNILIGCVLGIGLLLLGIHLTTNTLDLSRDNIGWNGSSEFFSHLNRVSTDMVTDISDLAGRKNTTFLIIAPGGNYTAEEILGIREYILAGNTLFLVDESEYGPYLLKDLGSNITLKSEYLASLDRAYNDSLIIVTSPVIEHPLTWQTPTLILDKAKYLTGGETIYQSSIMSWIDTNTDSRISIDESFGKYTVIAREPFGKGEIIVLSDSSIMINSMGGLGDNWGNEQFINNVIRYKPHLLVDQVHSQTADSDGIGPVIRVARSVPALNTGLVTIILLIIAFLVWRRPPRGSIHQSEPVEM